jgi:hypothetical protein
VKTPTTGEFIPLIAGRYLLRQGLFYLGLFFIGTGNPVIEPQTWLFTIKLRNKKRRQTSLERSS